MSGSGSGILILRLFESFGTYHEANAYFKQSRAEMLQFGPESASNILDVGCGAGRFSETLRTKYPEAKLYGIEADPQAAAVATQSYDQIWSDDVLTVLGDQIKQSFDVVFLNDILEHLVDPWSCLRQLRKHLSPGACVIASIPNMRFWPILSDLVFHAQWRYREAGVMDRTHLRFFTKSSIVNLFNETGYRVLQIGGINRTDRISLVWRIANLVYFGKFSDCLYPQFAIVAALGTELEIAHV